MKRILIIIAAVALTGCSNLAFQWSASYQTDNLAEALRAREKAPERIEVDTPRDSVR